MLFDWIYPTYTPVMQRAVEIWYQDPQVLKIVINGRFTNRCIFPKVTTPILKLFAELVQNRSQRLQFDVSSPNGILLFRLTTRLLKREAKSVFQGGEQHHLFLWEPYLGRSGEVL